MNTCLDFDISIPIAINKLPNLSKSKFVAGLSPLKILFKLSRSSTNEPMHILGLVAIKLILSSPYAVQ